MAQVAAPAATTPVDNLNKLSPTALPSGIESLLKCTGSEDSGVAAARLLVKLLSNVLKNPEEAKFRKVVGAKVAKVVGAPLDVIEAALASLGFQKPDTNADSLILPADARLESWPAYVAKLSESIPQEQDENKSGCCGRGADGGGGGACCKPAAKQERQQPETEAERRQREKQLLRDRIAASRKDKREFDSARTQPDSVANPLHQGARITGVKPPPPSSCPSCRG